MKRKATKRRAAQKQPALADTPDKHQTPKRLPPFWNYDTGGKDFPRYTPKDGSPYWTVGMKIGGVTIPQELQETLSLHGGEVFLDIHKVCEFEPWRFFDHYHKNDGSRYEGLEDEIDLGDPASWKRHSKSEDGKEMEFGYVEWTALHAAINTAMAQGFLLALLRYAEGLKAVPEATAMLDSLRRNSAKGAAARRKQAAPTHRAIQKRFRELRKTTPKKTARYLRVAGEFKMSDRQIARIVDGID